jgi:hypothetical protein
MGRALPLWLATLLQFVGIGLLGIFAYALFLPTQIALFYVYGYLEAPAWILGAASPLLLLLAIFLAVVFSITTKWVLLGRVKPGTRPLWSFFHIRWLIVRMVVKTTLTPLFPLFRATPLINWYNQALGAKIGRNVIIYSRNIYDWDMLEVGDDVGECAGPALW